MTACRRQRGACRRPTHRVLCRGGLTAFARGWANAQAEKQRPKTKDINNDMQTILSHLLILKTAGSCR
ncbi:hypothetical protein X963_2890 [Burkholderia pseudomallei MSHR7498]|nr:hypothetical protein X963_2890 [Burkholderia pseudomallei MSHR7498]